MIYRKFLHRIDPTYPNLYLQVTCYLDPKTKLVNPARREQDVIIWVSPYGEQGMSDAFNAPSRGVNKEVKGSQINFRFVYFIEFTKVKVGVGVGKLGVEAEIKPGHGMVFVEGLADTKTLLGQVKWHKMEGEEQGAGQ